MSSPDKLRVRPIEADDVEGILELLCENWPRISNGQWRAVFDHGWDGEAPDYGFVLAKGDDVVGYLGTIYAERPIDGSPRRICNITSWYVQAPYRTSSLLLLQALLKSAEAITVLTPSRSTRPIMESFGFKTLDSARHFYFPLLHAESLLRGLSLKMHVGAAEIAPCLDSEQRRISTDLAKTDCGEYFLQEAGRGCYLVTKRRRLKLAGRRRPISEVLYCSDPEMFRRHRERVVSTVLLRERTVALAGDAGESVSGRAGSRRGAADLGSPGCGSVPSP